MNWYYSSNNEKVGPLPINDIAQLISGGTILDSTLLWRDGLANWRPLSDFKRDAALMDGTGYGFCRESGELHAADRLIKIGDHYVSADHKDAYVQKLQEGTLETSSGYGGEFAYGGFWIRFVAKFIDGIVLMIANFVGGFVVGMLHIVPEAASPSDGAAIAITMLVNYSIAFAIGSSYNAIFLPKFGATPGKMILGLKVARPTGENISIGQAIGRYFAEFLSGIIFLIGYIMAGFDDEKRALHDRICSTRVIVK